MILANINVLVITISIVDVTYEAYTHFGLQKQGDRMQVVPASGEFRKVVVGQLVGHSEAVEERSTFGIFSVIGRDAH